MTAKAQPNIELYELKSLSDRFINKFAYNIYYANVNEINNRPAETLTKVRVISVPDVTREITILGQVKLPGTYAYQDSMRILDILNIAGGLEDSTYLKSIYTKEAEIIRQIHDSFYPKRIPINIDLLLSGQEDQNIYLQNNDILIVRENSRFTEPKYVTISGEVNIPGKYTIQKKEETLESIINRAGGFAINAFDNGLHMYRDSAQVVLKGYDIIVADGDSIFVPESPGIVTVQGQVNKQGQIQYVPGKTLRYYLEKAGGFSHFADKKNVIVQYANGNVRKKKNFITSWLSLSPPVKDGSTITVYQAQPRQPFNAVQFLSATAQAASSLVTMYLLYEQINSSN
jgi:protein involved in polysaccharide export with SLBB domain